MPNKNYLRGRRLEYELVEYLKLLGCDWAQRMAGSHSPYDVVGVSLAAKTVYFIQGKTKLGDKVGIHDSEYSQATDWKVVMFKRTKLIKKRG